MSTITKPSKRARLDLGDGGDDSDNGEEYGWPNTSIRQQTTNPPTTQLLSSNSKKKRVNPFLKAVDDTAAPKKIKPDNGHIQGSVTSGFSGSEYLPPCLALENHGERAVDGKIADLAVQRHVAKVSVVNTRETEESDEEDDYLSMNILDPAISRRESYSERMKRKQRESETRGRQLSKVELARMEKEKREEGLKRSLLEDKGSRGFKIMKKMGWKADEEKGRNDQAEGETPMAQRGPISEPLALNIKSDRAGIGHLGEEVRKFQNTLKNRGIVKEGTPEAEVETPEAFRQRMHAEREERKKESQFYAAQKILEELDTEELSPEEATRRQLKSVPLLYRSLIRHRVNKERSKQAKREFLESLSTTSNYHSVTGLPRPKPLPGYEDEDEVEEKAMLGGSVAVDDLEDLEDEDEELNSFNEKNFSERLELIVKELRDVWNYCFWCKWRYKNGEEMQKECPGKDEDLHG